MRLKDKVAIFSGGAYGMSAAEARLCGVRPFANNRYPRPRDAAQIYLQQISQAVWSQVRASVIARAPLHGSK